MDPTPNPMDLAGSYQAFLALAAEVRPELHRFCARMTGSVADGEDVVQDALMTAFRELPSLTHLPALRPWLFRIAHNRAIDELRRYDRRMGGPLEDLGDAEPVDAPGADALLARSQAVGAALSRFTELVPLQRSAVILKDVLDHSLEDIADLLGLSVPAVKAALHRGRTRLAELGAADPRAGADGAPPTSPLLARYAAAFNARDWDAVRAMLADDVRLDVVDRERRRGRGQVGRYFTNYDRLTDWHMAPAWLDGREVLSVGRAPGDPAPSYFVGLDLDGERVAAIRDFRHVPYIGRDARFLPSR